MNSLASSAGIWNLCGSGFLSDMTTDDDYEKGGHPSSKARFVNTNLHIIHNTMKFSQAVSLLTTLSITANGVMAFAAVAEKLCEAGGAGVHVPIGKDGEGEYTASTKGWYVMVLSSCSSYRNHNVVFEFAMGLLLKCNMMCSLALAQVANNFYIMISVDPFPI